MSYNIDTWTTKKLENLRIPFSALTDEKVVTIQNGVVKANISLCEDGYVRGELQADGMILVREIKLCGLVSGNALHDVLVPALEQSAGELAAILIWEGGDSITRLTAVEGVVNQVPVEVE